MNNKFYTYAFLREDGTPYYIGKGCGNRCYEKHGRKVTPPSRDRILILKRNLTEEEAFKHEIYMIAVFGRKNTGAGILLNFTDGGEGASGCKQTAETKLKKSIAFRQIPRTREWGENISKAKKGKKKGPMSEECKKKISEAMRGRSPSNEHRANLSKSQKGRKLTEEHKQKLQLPKREVERRIALITEANIDLSEYGALSKIAKLLGLASASTRDFLNKYYPKENGTPQNP
jgi:hypothetical protein